MIELERKWESFSKRPFPTLVRHFVNRLFASEEEQAGSSMGLGIGAVLAILASPGAFASIFLLGKYSTLLQWMRGEHIDAIRRSPSDEYFFVVLSMTITGFVMVGRWNRLFPDRRDFTNLAALPIPIRNIFLANFAALVALGIVFALDVNVVSALFFPLFVTMSYGTFAAFVKVGVGHVLTVFSASLFSFFAVFGLVGLLMLIVPRQISRIVSVAVRIVLVVALLAEFFSNIFLQLFAGRSPGQAGHYMRLLPSYWFLGIYEQMLGIAKPSMASLGRQALEALALTVVISTIVYVISYRAIFVRLPETFDMMGSSRPFFRVKLPDRWLAWLFRSSFERGCSTFTVKALLRSEQHLMFLGAYLGIGFVVVAQSALDWSGSAGRQSFPTSDYLSVALLLAFFAVSGLRYVFDSPAALEANWLFKMSAELQHPAPRDITRRLILSIVLPPEILLLTPITAAHFGWKVAVMHSAITVALTLFATDALLAGYQKIPFTCCTHLDIKRLIGRMLGTAFGALLIVPALASIELWMLRKPPRSIGLAIVLTVGWRLLDRYRREVESDDRSLRFEDGPGEPFELLKLT